MSDLTHALAAHPFCQGLLPEHIARLATCATEQAFEVGDYLAREGHDADASYLIRSGRVALRSGRETLETVESDQLLGWSWLLDGTTWHVDAVAVLPVAALRLDGPALDAQMHLHPAFGHAFARQILRSVHQRLERARLRSLDVFGGSP